MLAQRLDLPVLPIRIDGLAAVRDEGRRFAKRGEITVRVGRPIKFEPDLSAEEIARQLQAAVRDV